MSTQTETGQVTGTRVENRDKKLLRQRLGT
jgi:hypothetical protein